MIQQRGRVRVDLQKLVVFRFQEAFCHAVLQEILKRIVIMIHI